MIDPKFNPKLHPVLRSWVDIDAHSIVDKIGTKNFAHKAALSGHVPPADKMDVCEQATQVYCGPPRRGVGIHLERPRDARLS